LTIDGLLAERKFNLNGLKQAELRKFCAITL
jgi:hypothetical protein